MNESEGSLVCQLIVAESVAIFSTARLEISGPAISCAGAGCVPVGTGAWVVAAVALIVYVPPPPPLY